MNKQVIRLYQILILLPRYPVKKKITEIHDLLAQQDIGISIRSLQRDMLVLQEIFAGIVTVPSDDRSNYWYWSKDAKLENLSGFTVNQALSLTLIKKFLEPLLPKVTLNELKPFFEQADKTLNGLKETSFSKWPNKIAILPSTQPLLPPVIKPEIHEKVSDALLNDEQIRIEYKKLVGQPSTYEINPLGMVLQGGVTYLVASLTENQAYRIFALHRIKSVNKTWRDSNHPKVFDLKQYIQDGNMGFNFTGTHKYSRIRLVVTFDEVSIKHLYETQLTKDQVIEDLGNGRFKLTATLQETEQLFWWLQSFGSRVEVLEPPELRNKMAKSVKVMAQRYQI